MKSRTLFNCLLVLCLLPGFKLSLAGDNFRFAQDFSTTQLLTEASARDAFAHRFMRQEGQFHQDRIGYSAINGMTYDAQLISPQTGETLGMMYWSAPYQEDVHLIMLSMAIAGNKLASLFISPDDPARAGEKALDILTKKIATLERFKKEYPGFRGFLPWFAHCHDGRDIEPCWNYTNNVKSQQNAAFVWSLILTDYQLDQAGHTNLAKRYADYWHGLSANAIPVFYNTEQGKIRSASQIIPQTNGTFRYGKFVDPHYHEGEHVQPSCEHEWLNTPFFGELMTLFMTLFSPWDDPSQPEAIWSDKSVVPAEYHTKDGNTITVRQGEWYSAIEMSTMLYLPYTDVPLIHELVRLGEVARTRHSNESGIPGLFSMVSIPYGMTIKGAEELYAVGIPSLASEQVIFTNVIAPYAAFPVILADKPAGLAWLLNTLKGRKVQGPYGMSEGISVDGQHTAMFLTWYSKGSVLLALLQPNLRNAMRCAMQKLGVYDRFIELVSNEYAEGFGSITNLHGRELTVAPPQHPIPQPDIAEFATPGPNTMLLHGVPFRGGGALETNFSRNADHTLCLKPAKGFIFTLITPVDLTTHPYIVFKYKAKETGSFSFELKNRHGMPFNRTLEKDRYGGGIKVKVENTEDTWKTQAIDLRPFMENKDQTVITFVITDPTTTIELNNDGTVITPDPQQNEHSKQQAISNRDPVL